MIDRDAIEAKARELEEVLEGAGQSLRSKAAISSVGAVAALAVAFLSGRKRGRSKAARIEIHRL